MAAKKKAQEAPRVPINTYGCKVVGQTQLFYDRWALAHRVTIDDGAAPRGEMFRRVANILLPNYFEWHPWTDKIVDTLCDLGEPVGKPPSYKVLVGIPGCSNSAKTHNVVGFAVCWWLAEPSMSSVTLVSTTKGALRQRGWANVQKAMRSIPGPRIGNFVDSKMMWQSTPGEAKHAIICKAVEEGSTTKVADDIKGVHTKRQMVIIDEATAVPEAIFDAVNNLYTFPREFILVVIGNPRSRLDQFGTFIEPEGGWNSISIDDEEWLGKPQKDYGGIKPRIIRFDAEKSPNIVKGKVISLHLPVKEWVDRSRAASGGQTPIYWSNFRGFPPPDGLTKTVFSEAAIAANKAQDGLTFTGEHFQIIGTFDPAFGGGDRPALRFAKLGEIEGGKWGIELMPPIVVPIDSHSNNPAHFQLAEQVRRQCESFKYKGATYSCPPESLGVDATGEGGGLCDIIQRMWSPKIIRIEFAGAASTDAASLEDARPANEVYENKTVEMHFRARDALNHGQLKGIDRETAVELCTREFDDSGKRIKLQKKADFKKKFRKISPDFGDSAVMMMEVARRKGFRLAAIGQTVNRVMDFDKEVRRADALYSDVDYSTQDDEFEFA